MTQLLNSCQKNDKTAQKRRNVVPDNESSGLEDGAWISQRNVVGNCKVGLLGTLQNIQLQFYLYKKKIYYLICHSSKILGALFSVAENPKGVLFFAGSIFWIFPPTVGFKRRYFFLEMSKNCPKN